MKDFLKYMAATVVGFIIFSILTVAFGFICIVGMIASENSAKDVSDNSVMVLNLSGMLNERSEDNVMDKLSGNTVGNLGLEDIVDAIKKAKKNDKIKGIYIEAGMFGADSYASLQAIRNALKDFKKSGKWIVSYSDVYTQGTYYVASVADKVLLNPSGQVDWHGLASQPVFLKDMLAKFGVKMQLAKVGAYKSAPEMFTADKMSDPNREQVTAYLTGTWQNICKDVSESRNISVDSLNAYADRLITFDDPKDLVRCKMVDKLIYTDGIKAEINQLLKKDAGRDINTVNIAQMQLLKDNNDKGDEIAVYYAYGNIVDSEETGMMSQGHNIVGNKVCKDLQELADDDDVKAVVLRINSGGGSAYASEQIWHYVEMLKKKKPVVVSMGGMAASGGYYISSGANWIVAEPTTLTGSIGIFGMFPDFSGLLTQKLGIKFDEVKTNKNSGLGTPARPFNAEEMAYIENYIDRGYKLFRSRVAEGRKLTTAQVEKIAQGHVWLGQDAYKIKLVDQLGGLDEAVDKAASLAKLHEYHTTSYPGKSSWMDQLLSEATQGSYIDSQLRLTLGEYYEPFMLIRSINKQNAVQARLPFILNIR